MMVNEVRTTMSNRTTKQSMVFAGFVAAGVLMVFAYQAGAQRGTRARPTAVATVNLTKVLEGLEERAAAERDLEAMQLEFKKQDEARMAEIDEMEATLEDIIDAQAKLKKRDDIDLKTLEFLSWRRVKAEQLDVEMALLLQDLYRKIATSIDEQGKANGYDLVLVDDSSSDFSYNPDARVSREIQVRQQIVSRRMLWGAEEIDMTEDLIVRMNNAFQSGSMATGNGQSP